jgi:hypothetical protein
MKWYVPAIILFFLTCSSSYAKHVEIIYVNANVGAAAGGHVGLKLDNDVFHYQFYPDDRFLLVRESWESFTLIYNRLRNRTIYAARCSVSEAAFAKVKNHFTTLLASQKRDFSNHRFLSDQKLMLAGFRTGSLELPVRGLGFFAAHEVESESGVTLRSSIYTALGKTYLLERREAISGRLHDCLIKINEDGSSGDALTEKIEEISALKKKQAAYDIIIEGRGLLDSALAVGLRAKLSRKAHDNLNSYFKRRLQVLTHLLASDRSDIGEAILIETARCQALIDSLTRGMLVTLDPYPAETIRKQLDLDTLEMQRYLAALIEILSRECSELLLTEVNSVGAETDYHYLQIENVNGRLAEIAGAVNAGQGIRLSSDMMLPSRSRTVRMTVPILKDDVLDDALVSIDNDLSLLERDFENKYRYRLIDRNCVNELLKNLNSSFSGEAETEAALGDWIDPVDDRVVIPHNFFYQVSTRYNVEQVRRYPSRRIAEVEAMKDQSDTAELWFREGNTLSTTVYRSRTDDTPFLFFTDDVKWARPVLGLANLVWSTAHGLAGIFTLPVKGVEPVHQALRGMFYSLPELVFFNIRKGTYLHDAINEGEHEL